MPEIALPEEILQIMLKRLYSDNVVSSISKQATLINKNLQLPRNSMMIYAMNYKVLRIISGMSGLSYST